MNFCDNCMEQYEGNSDICPKCGYRAGTVEPDSPYLARGTVLNGNYTVGGVVGQGGFGITYMGWDKQAKRKVAIKEYLPSEFSTRVPGVSEVSVFNDAKKQKQFHDGLVKFINEGTRISKLQGEEGMAIVYDAFEANNTAYIIREFLKGETLKDKLLHLQETGEAFDSEYAIGVMLPLIRSMKTLHNDGIYHLDISPDNIFMTTDGRTKLIDFSAYRHVTTSHSRSLSIVVKQGYSPEELYRSSGDTGAHTDVYSLAAVLYRMLTGKAPPDALDRRMVMERGKKDTLLPIRKRNPGVTKSQEAAIMNALNILPEDRTADVSSFADELTGTAVKRRRQKVLRPDDGKWPRWAKAAVAAGAAAAAAVVVLIATGVIGIHAPEIVPDGMSRVPSLVNMSVGDAEQQIEAAALQYTIVGKEYSGAVPANFVLAQDVTAGSIVEANSLVSLTISGGEEMRLVPYVEGSRAEEAQELLEAEGFDVRLIYEYSSIAVIGNVISQSAEGGKDFAVGGTVILYISKGHDPDDPGPYMSNVPDVKGLPYADAVKASNEAGFAVEVTGREYSEHPENTIISQSLQSGSRVMTDQPMRLVVSLGEHTARVPDVQFKEESVAVAKLKDEGFAVNVIKENSESVAKGSVISQDFVAGSVIAYGTEITISISTGGVPFNMPDVTGMDEASAKSTLAGKGLSVSVSYEHSATVADGKVIRQSPPANSQLVRGDRVTITVSSGKVIVTVPSVIGMSRSEAERELNALKLKAAFTESYSDTVQSGYIITQTPAAGSSQTEGTTINIILSKGKEPVTVPNVVNKTEAAATAELTAAGLKPLKIREEYDKNYAAGTVKSQNPTSGRTAYRGDTIELVISLGPETAVVPYIVGHTKSNADTLVKNAGLKLQEAGQQYSSTIPAGAVIAQSPDAGITVERNSVVSVIISKGREPVSVPNVVGADETTAAATLAAAGLSVTVVYKNTDSKPAGTVLAQNPSGGASAYKGDIVTLTVARETGEKIVANVAGMTESAAVNALNGFHVSVSREYSATVGNGLVIRQNPESGTMLTTGGTVTIVVSLGRDPNEELTVANVTGQTEAAAKNALSDFIVTVVQENSDTVSAGTVIRQTPGGGTKLAKGGTVTIYVSIGAAELTVANVTGQSESAAKSALSDFNVTVVQENSDTVPAGTVIRQTPGGGTKLAKGGTVTIYVSIGAAELTVANVTGQSESAAQSALSDFNVTVVQENSDTVSAGTVIRQTPEGGTKLAKGGTVTIYVSIGAAELTVANVTGQSESAAKSVLSDFNVTVIQENSDTVSAGTVIRQTPEGGTKLAKGGTVTIYVSLGAVDITLRNVVGMTKTDAENALKNDFKVTVVEDFDAAEAGKVYKQLPAESTKLPKGSEVIIYVSKGSSD